MKYARDYNVDLSNHRAKQLNKKLLFNSELVLVMDNEQLSYVIEKYPFTKGRTYLLGHWENKKIIYDPFKKTDVYHKNMVDEIYKSIMCWKNKL